MSVSQFRNIRSGLSLQLLWQYGERHYGARRYSAAADWFLAGTHQAFGNVTQSSSAKCHRKAALCHIQQKEYAKACNTIRQCPGEEAATHYVKLIIAVKQGERLTSAP